MMKQASKYVNLNRDRVKVVDFDERQDLFSAAPQQQQGAKRKVIRQASTNVVAAKLGTLTDEVTVSTGDPVICKCGAFFNHLSAVKVFEPEKETSTTDNFFSAGDKIWTCEFCGEKKLVDLEDEEKPSTESLDFILAPATEETTSSQDDSMILFCIDISGSMCVTTEVQGKHTLKGNDSSRLSALNTEGVSQFRPGQNHNVTYISRLQSVIAAVDSQLEAMEKEHPNRKIGLITFNREVTIVGDGIQQPEVVTGDKLYDYSNLLAIGSKYELAAPIKESKSRLSRKLFELEESGPTALGPALVVAVGMAAKGKGSKVVICTDGCSNVGVGALDELKTEEDRRAAEKFYSDVADLALLNGTTISVVSIKGDSCRLEELGVLSDRTNGDVDIVDPLNITKNFASILSLPVLATHVNVKLLVHNGLFLRDEDEDVAASEAVEGRNSLERDIGNVTAESEVTFEYGVRATVDKDLKRLPFQMQIRYQKLNGMQCIRIISQAQETTLDDDEAERDVDVDILGLNAARNAARLAQRGDYASARLYNMEQANLMKRAARTEHQVTSLNAWAPQQMALESHLNNEMVTELNEGLNLDDMDEDDDAAGGGADAGAEKEGKTKETRFQARKARRNDSTANALYQMVSKSAKKYTK